MPTILQTAVSNIDISTFSNSKDYLKAIYKNAKSLDASFSYAELSKLLGLGSRNVHSIITGARKFTEKSAISVGKILELSLYQKKYLIGLTNLELAKNAAQRQKALDLIMHSKLKLSPENLSAKNSIFFSKWLYIALFEILSTTNAKDDPSWISKHLSIKTSANKIAKALNTLEEIGFIKFDTRLKRRVPCHNTIRSDSKTHNMSIVNFHSEMLELAKSAIYLVSEEDREISSVCISTDKETRDKIKNEIHKFRQKIIELSNQCNESDEVIQVNFQLFPLFQYKDEK